MCHLRLYRNGGKSAPHGAAKREATNDLSQAAHKISSGKIKNQGNQLLKSASLPHSGARLKQALGRLATAGAAQNIGGKQRQSQNLG